MPKVPVPPPAALGDRYTLERELGRGGAATVYLAADRKHRRRVAVKVLRPEIAATIGTERFLREIEIVAGLTHPHILPLHDSGESDGVVYYVMPYVEGESLRDRLRREGQLPIEEALRIARDVGAALAHAHGHGIVHRDIKPENILLEGDEAVVADFGIARALDVAAFEPLSEPGLVVGTPVYMSPEQANGAPLDGRSDLYSLGCVLYEMLLGEPPFTGGTAQVIVARHRTEPPRPLRGLRPSVPPEVEAAVLASLAKSPADRPRTALELVRLLSPPASAEVGVVGAGTPSGVRTRTTTTDVPRRRRWWRRLFGALGLGLAVLASALLGGRVLDRSPAAAAVAALDPGLYAVLPFGHRGGAGAPVLSGDACESLLYQALSRWTGMRLVDPLWIADARARREHADGLAAALAVARERGARWFLTGDVRLHRDTVRIRAALYDAARDGATVREATVAVRPDLSDAEARFEELAQSLLTGASSVGGVAVGTALGTRSVPAWRSFERGMVALERWDLAGAETALEEAARLDPVFPQPRFWLAQARAWRGDPAAAWRDQVAAALRGEVRLAPAERERAQALQALGDERFADACERYAALVRADSFDFAAWFGLGECNRLDPVVVRDSTSPSGRRFRSSDQAAVAAYERALRLVPGSYRLFAGTAFERLAGLFITEPHVYRSGYAVEGDTLWFGAFPGIERDTFVFVPHRLQALFAGEPGTTPASLGAAIARGRTRLREVTGGWVRSFPASADARELHALALEATGDLDAAGDDPSALAEIRQARRASAGAAVAAAVAIRRGATETRILVKLGRFGDARRLADSLLAAWPAPAPEDAAALAGLAALTGRVHRTAALLRRAAPAFAAVAQDGTPVAVPPELRDALPLLAYASFGAPRDSILALTARLRRAIAGSVEPVRRAAVTQALLHRPLMLAFATTGTVPAERPGATEYLLRMQWDLVHGDTVGVRARIAELRLGGAGSDPLPIETALHEALLLLAANDSVGARRLIALGLDDLPRQGADFTGQVPQAAALGRLMALRAGLAATDAEVRRWKTARALLWHGGGATDAGRDEADPEH